MHDERYSRSIATEPAEWAFNRFLRGYVGAIPSAALLACLLYALGVTDIASAYGIGPVVAALTILPAIVAVRSMQIMPVGSEASFLSVRVFPKLGDGLRSIVMVAVLLMVWAFSAFILLGAIGMICSGIRHLLT